MTNSILKINKTTVKNKEYLILSRDTIYIMVSTLCKNLPLKDSLEIVAKYYNVNVKVVKKFLKFTKFDDDIVCIISSEEKGEEFLNHCNYLFLIYKTINKIIFEFYFRITKKYKKIYLLEIIRMVGEWFKEYDDDSEKIIFNAIKMELRKKKSKYKNFYKKYLDNNFIKAFEKIEFDNKIEKIFKKISKIF